MQSVYKQSSVLFVNKQKINPPFLCMVIVIYKVASFLKQKMSISALYILDLDGKPIISRNYRGVKEQEIDNFIKTKISMEVEREVTPVFSVLETNFAFIQHNNLYLVAIIENHANVLLAFVFLNRIVELMSDYFKEVEQESIRDNFVLMHELLDEVMDFGYPQITDSSVLKEYILQESKTLSLARKVPATVTNSVSWRSEGILYNKNKLLIDVVENIDVVIDRHGLVITSEINGYILLTVNLSGMPQLQLGLNDSLVHKKDSNKVENCVDLDDVKFHQCVRLSRFEKNRVISFIPPDGSFELMSYRITNGMKPPILITCFVDNYSKYKINYFVKAVSKFNSSYVAHNVVIMIPLKSDVDSPVLKTSYGKVSYVPEQNVLKWSLNKLHGRSEFSLNASFRLPSVENEDREDLGPIQVEFEIPFLALSGLKVQYLKVLEKSEYKSVTWIRYMTNSRHYQIRYQTIPHS